MAFREFIEGLPGLSFSPQSVDYADLGTGGGFPGLYLSQMAWIAHGWLIEARVRRAEFLSAEVERSGASERVEVLCDRAELVGNGELRESCDLVTARAFGSPSVTAECGSSLLRVGGVLVVSDPPGNRDADRWPPQALAQLGLRVSTSSTLPFAFTALEKVSLLPGRFPRRSGALASRPLF